MDTPSLVQQLDRLQVDGVADSRCARSESLKPNTSSPAKTPQDLTPSKSILPIAGNPERSPKADDCMSLAAYFRAELDRMETSLARTLVILQDECYGHRFSRPKTTKAGLSTIVERPERIHAALSGIAAAYIRLGGRHRDGHRQNTLQAWLDLPKPFRIRRSARRLSLMSTHVVAVHGSRWMEQLQTMCHNAAERLAAGDRELASAPGLHEGDLYLCKGSLAAIEGCLGAVCDAVDAVFTQSSPRVFCLIRPPGHHCSSDLPSGFCWVNNVHVGIQYAASTHGLTHAAIIDFDLHHGDGSQAMTWAHNARVQNMPKNTPAAKKTAIGYFSLHDINSYPCESSDEEKVRNASLCIDNAHGQSIWNVHLQPWKTEDEFWMLYRERYCVLLEKTRSFLRASRGHPQPKAAIFLSAGFDASEHESPFMQRHQVNVPTSFYARFTQDVVQLAQEPIVDGRVISVLEGGYSDRALSSGILSHLCGLSSEDNLQSMPAAWWSKQNLEEFETVMPSEPAKKPRVSSYSSATQASTAKMVGPAPVSAPLRESPSPPDAVHWAQAAHELRKVLIPKDRETRSCRIEDLAAEATRIRRSGSREMSNSGPMQLREKRTKAPSARTNRRRTLAEEVAPSTVPLPTTPEPLPRIRSSPKTAPPKNRSDLAEAVEGIAASMTQMSIKLHVPSREEHDARQEAKLQSFPHKRNVSPRKKRPAVKATDDAANPASLPAKADPSVASDVRNKVQLPVFTATSELPFGEQAKPSIWDVPKTPGPARDQTAP